MDKKFSYSEAISFGFRTSMDHLPLFIRLLLMLFVVFIIPVTLIILLSIVVLKSIHPGFFSTLFAKMFLTAIGIIISVLTLNWYNAGFLHVYLKLVDENDAKVKDLFIPFGLSLKYLAVAAIRYILTLLGMLLFIIPGIIVYLRYYFVKILVIDRSMNIDSSLATSHKLTDGHKWHLFWFECILNLVLVLPAVLFHIIGALVGVHELFIALISSVYGFIVSIATVLARVYVYRKFFPKNVSSNKIEACVFQ